MPERRYVLLRHECPADYRDGPHWDLMLEDGDALRTWSLLELPTAWGGTADAPFATELPRHRLAYLEYEGEVSGGRGTVERAAGGTFVFVVDEPHEIHIKALDGDAVGQWRLQRIDSHWRLLVCR